MAYLQIYPRTYYSVVGEPEHTKTSYDFIQAFRSSSSPTFIQSDLLIIHHFNEDGPYSTHSRAVGFLTAIPQYQPLDEIQTPSRPEGSPLLQVPVTAIIPGSTQLKFRLFPKKGTDSNETNKAVQFRVRIQSSLQQSGKVNVVIQAVNTYYGTYTSRVIEGVLVSNAPSWTDEFHTICVNLTAINYQDMTDVSIYFLDNGGAHTIDNIYVSGIASRATRDLYFPESSTYLSINAGRPTTINSSTSSADYAAAESLATTAGKTSTGFISVLMEGSSCSCNSNSIFTIEYDSLLRFSYLDLTPSSGSSFLCDGNAMTMVTHLASDIYISYSRSNIVLSIFGEGTEILYTKCQSSSETSLTAFVNTNYAVACSTSLAFSSILNSGFDIWVASRTSASMVIGEDSFHSVRADQISGFNIVGMYLQSLVSSETRVSSGADPNLYVPQPFSITAKQISSGVSDMLFDLSLSDVNYEQASKCDIAIFTTGYIIIDAQTTCSVSPILTSRASLYTMCDQVNGVALDVQKFVPIYTELINQETSVDTYIDVSSYITTIDSVVSGVSVDTDLIELDKPIPISANSSSGCSPSVVEVEAESDINVLASSATHVGNSISAYTRIDINAESASASVQSPERDIGEVSLATFPVNESAVVIDGPAYSIEIVAAQRTSVDSDLSIAFECSCGNVTSVVTDLRYSTLGNISDPSLEAFNLCTI